MTTKENDHYRQPTANEIIQLRRYLGDIRTAALFFKEFFIDKVVVYVTETENRPVVFRTTNFAHLCGIEYEYGTNLFFKHSLTRKINLGKIRVKTDESTFLKLMTIKKCCKIIKPGICLTQDGLIGDHMHYRNSILNDESTTTERKGFFISLIVTGDSLAPQSLINLSSLKNDEIPTIVSEVVEIFAVDFSNNNRTTYYKKS